MITPAFGRRFGRIDQQIHQDLRKLIGINQDVGQVFGNLVLRSFAAQRRLAFEKAQRIANQAPQAEVAQHQRSRTGVIDQSAQGGGNALGAGNALLDFPSLLGIAGALQLEFQVRQDPEQGIVNPVRRPQRQLREGRIFFVFGQLSLKLEFLLVQFTIFVQAAKEFFLCQIALTLQLLLQFRGLLQGFANSLPIRGAAAATQRTSPPESGEGERKEVADLQFEVAAGSSCQKNRQRRPDTFPRNSRLVPNANASSISMKRSMTGRCDVGHSEE